MLADIQKIEAAARMSMGDYDFSSAAVAKTRRSLSRTIYLLAGLMLAGTLALAFA